MSKAYKGFTTKETPQTKPIPGREKDMVKNDAGGYAFKVPKWETLDRFLILGTEGGTYYVKEQEHTLRNAQNVINCVKEDGIRTVNRIVEISDAGRAPKNTPAIFALAIAAWAGDKKTKELAYQVMPKVARTGYHHMMWAQYCDQLRGTGMGFQKASARWFNDKGPQHLALQAVKYQQREGWTLRDLLRLSHVKPVDEEHDMIYRWIAKGWDWGDIPDKYSNDVPVPPIIWAHEQAKRATDKAEIISLIESYRIPRESIPTQFFKEPDVWDAMLRSNALPMWAALRNLGKMTQVGLLDPLSDATSYIVSMFDNEERLRKSRMHPLSILVAMKVYEQGHGVKGSLRWDPVPKIVDVLDAAFYKSFGLVEPTNQSYMLSLDVSSSMAYASIAGMPLSAREASAAMLLITANVEDKYVANMFQTQLTPLSISPRERLDDVTRRISGLQFGGTDCAKPMEAAYKKGYHIDTFVIYTDNETWAGSRHPAQALQRYRDKFNPDAKMITVGMTATESSIADPNDPGMLDVVGFDTATPNIISEFSLNK